MYDITVTRQTLDSYGDNLQCRAPLSAQQVVLLPHQIYLPQKKQRIIFRTTDLTQEELTTIAAMKSQLSTVFS